MPGSKRDNQLAIANVRRTRCHDQTSVWYASGGLYASCDFLLIACVDGSHFKVLRRSHGLDDGELPNPRSYCEITKHCRPRDVWRDLLKQLRPLSGQAIFELQKTCGVTTRAGKTFDKPGADRIGDICEHDRDAFWSPGIMSPYVAPPVATMNVRTEGNKFRRVFAQRPRRCKPPQR